MQYTWSCALCNLMFQGVPSLEHCVGNEYTTKIKHHIRTSLCDICPYQSQNNFYVGTGGWPPATSMMAKGDVQAQRRNTCKYIVITIRQPTNRVQWLKSFIEMEIIFVRRYNILICYACWNWWNDAVNYLHRATHNRQANLQQWACSNNDPTCAELSFERLSFYMSKDILSKDIISKDGPAQFGPIVEVFGRKPWQHPKLKASGPPPQ